jgi:hypothetical protein
MLLRMKGDDIPRGEHWEHSYPVDQPGFDYSCFEPRYVLGLPRLAAFP